MNTPKTTPAPIAPRRRPRRLAVAALAVVVALAAAYGGYWMVLSSRLEAGILGWIAERRAEGYEVRYAALERGGFPRSARVVMTAPAIAAPALTAPGNTAAAETAPWAWSATRLAVGLDPLDPRHLSIEAPGAHALSIGEGPGRVRYEAAVAQLTVVGEAGTGAGALEVRDLVLWSPSGTGSDPADRPPADPLTGPLSETALTIARLDATGRPVSGNGGDGDDIGARYRFILSAGDAVLPRWLDLPLGHALGSLDVEGTVQGELALTPWPEALFRWRDAGGVIDVAALEATYGPLTLAGSGTLALDPAGQPIAAFATRVSGLFAAIDTLRANGYLGQGDALVAKLAVNVLAGTSERQARLALPLTLQDRSLFIGPVQLMTLPEISWLGPPPR